MSRPEALVEEAVAAVEAGRIDDALAAADEAARRAPGHAPAHHVRSIALEALGRVPEAREAAERALALDADNPALHEQLGDLWIEEDARQAEAHYRASLRCDSWDRRGKKRALVLNNLGVALSRQKRDREAALAFRSALLVDPTVAEAKENARLSLTRMIRGAALLAAVVLVTKVARLGGKAARETPLQPWLLGLTALGLAAAGAIWLWRRTAGMRRLAVEEPQLYQLWERLDLERRAPPPRPTSAP